jgi:uncharacterized protein (DUF302 family)
MTTYGMSSSITGSWDEVKGKVVAALKEQGFGILTEIDVQKVLKEKLGVDFEPYLIMGACNPGFAHQALSADRSIGLLLPCNVVLRQNGSKVDVSIQDPEVMFSVVEIGANSDLAKIPQEAKQRLQIALKNL